MKNESRKNKKQLMSLKINCLQPVKCPQCEQIVYLGTTVARINVYDCFANAMSGQYNEVLELHQTVHCPSCKVPIAEYGVILGTDEKAVSKETAKS